MLWIFKFNLHSFDSIGLYHSYKIRINQIRRIQSISIPVGDSILFNEVKRCRMFNINKNTHISINRNKAHRTSNIQVTDLCKWIQLINSWNTHVWHGIDIWILILELNTYGWFINHLTFSVFSFPILLLVCISKPELRNQKPTQMTTIDWKRLKWTKWNISEIESRSLFYPADGSAIGIAT